MKQHVLFASPVNSTIVTVGLVVLLIMAGYVLRSYRPALIGQETVPQQRAAAATLRAASGQTVLYLTGNGRGVDGSPAVEKRLPLLVLRRNGQLTTAAERTLTISLSGIEVPPPGITVTLSIDTQHADPDLGHEAEHRLTAWTESRWIPNDSQTTLNDVSTRFVCEFNEFVTSPIEVIPTPTDYFSYRIVVFAGDHPASAPQMLLQEDYAFLMENQAIAPLPTVAEESIGAAPDALIINYMDMIPFQKDSGDPATRLTRGQISGFVVDQLLPQMVQAFQLQSDGWDFTWYEAWTNYRGGKSEWLSVALSDEQTWFHGPPPVGGSAEISLNTAAQEYRYYENLGDALLATFHHELFHNLQRNISQHYGNQGQIDGKDEAWALFTEGTAVLAPTVAQPELQFAPHSNGRFFMAEANAFLGDGGVFSGLNTSYQRLRPYQAALYWRFLYEQCGGMSGGIENPAAGMTVIRRTLETLYRGELVDIDQSSDLVSFLPAIMDQALAATATCPFTNYAQSLARFAQYLAHLRMDNGRCLAPGIPAGCRFYDPHRQYGTPPVDLISYTGQSLVHDGEKQLYPAGIGSSFGMDFVDVMLDPAADGQALTLQFYGQPGSMAQFQVQVWPLLNGEADGRLRPVSSSQTLSETNQAGRLVYTVPAIDTSQLNRLSLIIIRVDAAENADAAGAYTLLLN